GRVVLRKPEPTGDRFQSVRGWRSFTSVPVRDAEITVTSGTTRGTVHADRGGVIDARVDVDLPPGWSTVHLSVADAADRTTTVELRVFVVDEAETFVVVSDV